MGKSFENGLDYERRRLNANCGSPLALVFHFGEKMKERHRGGIVVMSSETGLIGSPHYTHYAATKAYDVKFGRGFIV